MKTETRYIFQAIGGNKYENISIVQEEDTPDRKAIKVKFFEERWRTPEDAVELLKKVITVIEENFVKETN